MARKKKMDKLSQDAADALAASMSYGKWKSMQRDSETPGKTAQAKAPISKETLMCKWCCKPFMPKTKRVQLYCSDDCQAAAYRARNREKIAAHYKEWKNRKEQLNESNA
jgi:hypothetical protein